MPVARNSPSGPPIAPLVRGTNLTVNAQGKLEPVARPRRFFEWDYFITGNTTSGSIGKLGWNLFGVGTPSVTRGNVNLGNSNKVTLLTSASAGDSAILCLGAATNNTIGRPDEFAAMQWHTREGGGGGFVDKRMFWGFQADMNDDPLVSGNTFGMVFDSGASQNYLFQYRAGSSAQTIDTGYRAIGGATMTTMLQDPDDPLHFQWWFSNINNDDSSSSPAQLLVDITIAESFDANVGYRLQTLANSVAGMESGFWGCNSAIIGGIFSADDFLEG